MRKFRTIQKKVTVEITSKDMNISLDFANEIAKSIGSESEWQDLTDLKGSDIERISSSKFSIKLENLMDMAYRDLGYAKNIQKKLGFYSSEKHLVSGYFPRNRKERIYQTFKVNVSRESMSIMKSIKNKTLKLSSKMGTSDKCLDYTYGIEILKEQEKVFPLPIQKYSWELSGQEKLERSLTSSIFWSSQWESKPRPKKKSLSSEVEVFKSIDDYNRSDRRVGKPI